MATALSTFREPQAFGSLNNVLAMFHAENAYGRPNLYEILIFGPNHLGGGGTLNPKRGAERGHNTREISLRAESLILPGRGLQVQVMSGGAQYGPQRETVTEAIYAEDITMTFQSTAGLNERIFFENWQEQAFNVITHDAGYYYDYVGTLQIFLLDREYQKTYGLQCNEAYPVSYTHLRAHET